MNYIASRANSVIKQVALLASADERQKRQLFVAEGLRTCAALCGSQIKLQQLFVTKALVSSAQQCAKDSMITEVTDAVMEKISQTKTPSGILGVFHIPPIPTRLHSRGMVLAQVREPGNVGTLIRSCAAFGMKSVILVESADVWSHKVVQSTAGTLTSVDIFVMSWQELLAKKGHLKLCALVVHNGNQPSHLPLAESLLVIGNEAHGIPAGWLADCQQQMTIPMPGSAESLNEAVAGSIALYEMAKQS